MTSERFSKWVSEKKLDKKRAVAGILADCFPDCRNRSVIMMPSTTCLDIEAMKNASKMNGRTLLHGFEHLRSSCFSPRKSTSYGHSLSDSPYYVNRRIRTDFLLSLKKRLNGIFGNDTFYDNAVGRFTFGDILGSTLTVQFEKVAFGKGFRLIYADLCGVFSEKVATWVCWQSTIDSLSDDGVLAFTVMLNRWHDGEKVLAGDNRSLCHPCEVSFLGEYSEAFGTSHYGGLMNGIANCIERRSSGRLVAKRMIHYCEADRHSQMATLVFDKQR